ncbi:MAG: OmpA family protein [Gammaproteobacteria bacterium]|nr:OmpA family protein [Gammaproteobacteria bacterium]
MRIYTQPPSPQELADVLFPQRYRSIVLKQDTTTTSAQPLADETALAYAQPAREANMFGLLIIFEYDSTTIVATSLPLLDSVGEMMKLETTPDQAIIIEGHTDAIGGYDYNQELSERRARAIKRYLVSVFSIDPARLVVIGKGKRELYDKNKPTNSINRRVVFKPLQRKAS